MQQNTELDPIIVNIPCPTKEEAEKLCKELIEKELVGTAKITPTFLMYPGEKGAEGEEVVLMSLKSTKSNLKDINAFILENHSWGTPCIEVIAIASDMC